VLKVIIHTEFTVLFRILYFYGNLLRGFATQKKGLQTSVFSVPTERAYASIKLRIASARSSSLFGRGRGDDLSQNVDDPVDISALCVDSRNSHVTV
jgi:hypothetical protein